MKTFLGALAVVMLLGAATAAPASAACWGGWHCWHSYHPYWHHSGWRTW
jgi:hypothetical protein